MNFKWDEFKDAVQHRQGAVPILIGFVAQLVTMVLFLIPFLVIFGLSIVTIAEGNEEAGLAVVAGIFFFVILLVPFMVYISAGTLGSLKEVVTTGQAGGMKGFFKQGFKHFFPVLGYSTLAGIIIMALIMPGAILLAILGESSDMLGFFLNIVFTFFVTFLTVFLYPLVYLSVFEGNGFSNYFAFLKKEFKVLLLVGLVYSFVAAIPILGAFLSVLFIFFPLYVFVLYVNYPFLTEPTYEELEPLEPVEMVTIEPTSSFSLEKETDEDKKEE